MGATISEHGGGPYQLDIPLFALIKFGFLDCVPLGLVVQLRLETCIGLLQITALLALSL